MTLNTFQLLLIAVLALIICSLSLFHKNSLPNNISDRNTLDRNTYDTRISNLNPLTEKDIKLSEETFRMLKTGKGNKFKKEHVKRKGKFEVSFKDISSFPRYTTMCKAENINVKVSFKNCISQEITSKYCYGTCSSIFIPQIRHRRMKASFQSVSSCVPDAHEVIKIRLECPNQIPDHVYRRVFIINSCSCKQFFP